MGISQLRWAGALMEGRSLFGLNSVVKKTWDGTTEQHMERPMEQRMEQRTDPPHTESHARD